MSGCANASVDSGIFIRIIKIGITADNSRAYGQELIEWSLVAAFDENRVLMATGLLRRLAAVPPYMSAVDDLLIDGEAGCPVEIITAVKAKIWQFATRY